MRISDKLREVIEDQIATGQLAPGMALDEAALVERHGVSRTPVREALIQLAADGLVQIRPRRGAIVASLGAAELVEMFEVMAELESMCGRLAARRMTDTERAAMMAAHQECHAACLARDANTYFYCNERFHAVIYFGSHNRFLAEQTSQLYRRLRPYRRLQLQARNRLDSSFREHQAVVELINAGDADGAAHALRDHVRVQGERFSDLLAHLTELQPEPA